MITYPPGSIIGILGGGQLGRMTALAAAALGYHCHIYCQNADEPAAQVTNRVTIGAFDDEAALAAFANQVDVVTLEWENVPIEAMQIVAARKSLYPSAAVLAIVQDRWQEKTFARQCGLGTALSIAVDSAAEAVAALAQMAAPAILKTRRMGYDGQGQITLQPHDDAAVAWQNLGAVPAILEQRVNFASEISVIMARRADGVSVAFPPVHNIHKNGILAETHAPAAIAPELAMAAISAARTLADRLDCVGLLAVEMFVLAEPDEHGRVLLINEIAPRPHNSGHWTQAACATSQFEQLVRAICGLPLGDTTPYGQAVMYNLLGDDVVQWQEWLARPHAHLQLYGKTTSKAGRKMGHVTVLTPAPSNHE